MSALSTALQAKGLPAVVHVVEPTAAPSTPSFIPDDRLYQEQDSPRSTYSVLTEHDVPSPSSSSSSLATPSLSLHVPPSRPNEHLAVLLPRRLWKPDNLSTKCDNFFCPMQFSFLERRHHCRKCGGVFCRQCTSQTTDLLDTSNLSFLHPPKSVPLSSFESPHSPILPHRVCDDCWDQIHGCPSTPRTPDLVRPSSSLSDPLSYFKWPRSVHESGESSRCASPHTPPNTPAFTLPFERKAHSKPPSISSQMTSSTHPPRRLSVRASHMSMPDDEPSRGALDAYPLRRSSLVCKATGGGRWEPKQIQILAGYRTPVPGGKAPYELQLEKEAELAKLRRENPIIKDGDFQIRFPPEAEPTKLSRSFQLSTF